ncbi:MAG: GNAT family N-acetyltransferase [Spirochaetes bacterium]|nr:GNAT family N-acetyltransferase [Spirochaetota bacterium]
MPTLEFSFAPRMTGIDRSEWDGLASPYASPFLSWGFLALLEESLSMTPETGWIPSHLLVHRGGCLVAAAPFYLRSHSMGDFVFDFGLAELAERLGAPYYPKLVGVVPATPVPAWRVLVAPDEDEGTIVGAVLDAVSAAARRAGAGGVHFLWVDPGFEALLRGAQRLEWRHQRYLWRDEAFGDFGGFLSSFSKNMRRNVRRERDGVRASGLETRIVGASDVTDLQLRRMAEFYEATNDKFGPWGAKFLEPAFFARLPEFLPSGWALSAAFAPGQPDDPVAAALLFEGRDAIWGRYWGSRVAVPGLHFELCYYLPIEYALARASARGIASFDPGMGGEHKARRGFRSSLVSSFHEIFDRRVAAALARALPEANAAEAAHAANLDRDLPFRREAPVPGLLLA